MRPQRGSFLVLAMTAALIAIAAHTVSIAFDGLQAVGRHIAEVAR